MESNSLLEVGMTLDPRSGECEKQVPVEYYHFFFFNAPACSLWFSHAYSVYEVELSDTQTNLTQIPVLPLEQVT